MIKTKETKKAPEQKNNKDNQSWLSTSWSWSKFMGYNFR